MKPSKQTELWVFTLSKILPSSITLKKCYTRDNAMSWHPMHHTHTYTYFFSLFVVLLCGSWVLGKD